MTSPHPFFRCVYLMICFPPSSTRHVFNLVDSVRESSGKRKYLFIALRGFNFDFLSLCHYRLPVDQYPVGYEFDIDKVCVILESSCLFEVYEVPPPFTGIPPPTLLLLVFKYLFYHLSMTFSNKPDTFIPPFNLPFASYM